MLPILLLDHAAASPTMKGWVEKKQGVTATFTKVFMSLSDHQLTLHEEGEPSSDVRASAARPRMRTRDLIDTIDTLLLAGGC